MMGIRRSLAAPLSEREHILGYWSRARLHARGGEKQFCCMASAFWVLVWTNPGHGQDG
jgi:hypothetical protein